MVDNVPGSQFITDLFYSNAHLSHENHGMVAEICQLVNGLLFVVALGSHNDLGALLAHLFQDLIDALFKNPD